MCYDTTQLAFRIYKEAIRLKASPEEIDFLKSKWEKLKGGDIELYHASGFDHPDLAAFKMENSELTLQKYQWGLIPSWIKNERQAKELWNKTINARGETIFEKPSFKEAAQMHRCIVPVDGYFEHFHKQGKTFPYYIKKSDDTKMFIGGLTSRWSNPENGMIKNTFSFVTTKANEFLTKIHNNPKMKESRMLLILDDKDAKQWLEGNENEASELIKPNTSIELKAHTVRKLRGKKSNKNSEEAIEEVHYPELDEPLTLF
jgi:putative SOS response-associated peptidase YedK